MDTKSWFPMEITDFMGLLPPKSFTTDGLAKKFISVSYFIIFLWQNKDHSLSCSAVILVSCRTGDKSSPVLQ
jgi:hypothetical protein